MSSSSPVGGPERRVWGARLLRICIRVQFCNIPAMSASAYFAIEYQVEKTPRYTVTSNP